MEEKVFFNWKWLKSQQGTSDEIDEIIRYFDGLGEPVRPQAAYESLRNIMFETDATRHQVEALDIAWRQFCWRTTKK